MWLYDRSVRHWGDFHIFTTLELPFVLQVRNISKYGFILAPSLSLSPTFIWILSFLLLGSLLCSIWTQFPKVGPQWKFLSRKDSLDCLFWVHQIQNSPSPSSLPPAPSASQELWYRQSPIPTFAVILRETYWASHTNRENLSFRCLRLLLCLPVVSHTVSSRA